MTGAAIPDEYIKERDFGDATHFSRAIAIYSREEDRTVAWRCPDCGHEWERDWPKGPVLTQEETLRRIKQALEATRSSQD
jgi:hypothetical protein